MCRILRIEILAGTIVGAFFLTRNRWRVAPISEPKIFDLRAELGGSWTLHSISMRVQRGLAGGK